MRMWHVYMIYGIEGFGICTKGVDAVLGRLSVIKFLRQRKTNGYTIIINRCMLLLVFVIGFEFIHIILFVRTINDFILIYLQDISKLRQHKARVDL